MSDLITYTAILGRTQLIPGVQPVNVSSPRGECLVAHGYPPTITDPKRDFTVDVSDCTVYMVTHLGRGGIDILPIIAQELLEQALQAISEITIWNKAMDRVGKVTAFIRQVGRLDVKFFFIEASDDKLIAWRNPLFWNDREGAALLAGFLSNMVVRNGPAANPIPPITRRVMSSLDLVNLGFYTESFVNLFSLVDDLTQEVLKAGLSQKGLNADEQKSLLRAIKEDRLRLFLTNLSKLCDWKSIDVERPEVFNRLLKANSIRNKIMHGSMRLERDQTIESVNTLLETIDWLRSNPFGYDIPRFPLLQLAEADFMLMEAKGAAKSSQDQNEESIEKAQEAPINGGEAA